MMHEPQFFSTQAKIDSFDNSLLNKKNDFSSYVSSLDQHINKAMGFQSRALNRKKSNLIETLQKMKDQAYRQSQKSRKMQEFFKIHCEQILKTDIAKWDNSKEFFTKIFQLYELKIKQRKQQISLKKQQIQRKTKQLKEKLKNQRKSYTVQQFSQKLLTQKKERSLSKVKNNTQSTTTRMTRVKTQISLPSLAKQTRMKTLTGQNQDSDLKNYMKPIKTQKNISDFTTKQNIIEMMNWYKTDKSQYNWFQKLVFVDRNFKKVIQAIFKDD